MTSFSDLALRFPPRYGLRNSAAPSTARSRSTGARSRGRGDGYETHTGTRIPAVSDNSGQYTAPFLLPGEYDIAVQSPGFKAPSARE